MIVLIASRLLGSVFRSAMTESATRSPAGSISASSNEIGLGTAGLGFASSAAVRFPLVV